MMDNQLALEMNVIVVVVLFSEREGTVNSCLATSVVILGASDRPNDARCERKAGGQARVTGRGSSSV